METNCPPPDRLGGRGGGLSRRTILWVSTLPFFFSLSSALSDSTRHRGSKRLPAGATKPYVVCKLCVGGWVRWVATAVAGKGKKEVKHESDATPQHYSPSAHVVGKQLEFSLVPKRAWVFNLQTTHCTP